MSEEQLDKWCQEIDEEEAKREEETLNRVKWLKQRDLRKQEIERAWRLTKSPPVSLAGQKRKCPDDDDFLEPEIGTCQYVNVQQPVKPALSPLLTSLLKSPSQVPIATSSILHNAITQQTTKLPEVSSSQLHSFSPNQSDDCSQPLNADILDDNNLKIDDLAKSILVEDGPFPEIKKEEVDDIISEIIENNHDIVSDPEQHLQLDGNGDININLELDELEQEEGSPVKPEVVDPFEFQEDPIVESPVKTVKDGQHLPLYQHPSPVKVEEAESSPFETTETVVADEPVIASDCPVVDEEEAKPSAAQEDVSEKAEALEEEGSGTLAEAPSSDEPPSESPEDALAKPDDSSLPPSEAPEYQDDLYDNVNMEVKIDKTGKTKRDYSRPKKRDDKNFDLLLGIDPPHPDNDDEEKKEPVVRLLKVDNERSNSPWTEEEDGNSPACDDDKDYRNWKKSMMLVYNRLASNKYASLFFKPITEEQAPGYGAIVYRPMDLQTIKKNIDTGVIRTSLEFKRDVMLMFTNAIMFNKTQDTVYSMALQMQKESMDPVDILLQAEGQLEAPVRRETRTSEIGCKRKRGVEESAKKKKKDE